MMENHEQDDTKAKPTTAHPKPTDEVQLTIETVTPDTQQSVPETTVDSNEVAEKVVGANANEENQKQVREVEGQSEEVVPKNEPKVSDDEETSVENGANKEKEDGDERDKIETIAP